MIGVEGTTIFLELCLPRTYPIENEAIRIESMIKQNLKFTVIGI